MRVATVGGQLCRRHAAMLELDLEGGSAGSKLLDVVDRELARRGMNRNMAIEMLGAALFAGLEARIRGGTIAGALPRVPPRIHPDPPRPAPPPPPPPPDPTIEARRILGFEEKELLTPERIKERKRALAAVYHPDKPGGSTAQMQRVNAAADLLLKRTR